MGILKNLFNKKHKEESLPPPPPPPTGWRTEEGKNIYYENNKPLTGVITYKTGNRQLMIDAFIGGESIGDTIHLGKGHQTVSDPEDSTRQLYALNAAKKALAEGKMDEFENIKAKAVKEYNTQKAERQKNKEQNKINPAEKITEMRNNINSPQEQNTPVPQSEKAEHASQNETLKHHSNGKPAGYGFHTSYKGY